VGWYVVFHSDDGLLTPITTGVSKAMKKNNNAIAFIGEAPNCVNSPPEDAVLMERIMTFDTHKAQIGSWSNSRSRRGVPLLYVFKRCVAYLEFCPEKGTKKRISQK
jgi:hypothetical protein